MTPNEKLINEATRTFEHPNVRPSDSASIIIVDRRAGIPHVLMGRRSEKHVFYPGAFVFPGGRVDPRDGHAPLAADLDPATRDRLLSRMRGRTSEHRARAIALAGIREAFEEAGILIGRPGKPGKAAPADWNLFLSHGLLPDLSRLAFIMRAITPPRRPRRFDNRFFAVEADAIGLELPPSQRPTDELGELIWLPIEEAKSLKIPAVTQVALNELEDRLAAPGGLAADLPVPYYRAIRQKFLRELL